jgi:MFS family permease
MRMPNLTDNSLVLEVAPDKTRSALPYKWELIALLWLAYFFNRADKQLFSFVLPQIRADLHLSDVQLGLVATIFNWTYGVLVPFGGYFGDLLRRKWVISVSLVLWSIATMFTGFANGLIGLIILRSLATGAGESFYYPSATSLIGQFHQRTRALAMSIHQTALYVGVVVSGAIAGYLAQTYSWRHSFYFFGIGGIALGLLLMWRLKDTPHAAPTDEESPSKPERLPLAVILRELRAKPTVPLLALAFAGMAFTDIGYVTWMPTYLQERFKMSPASAGFSSMFYHHLMAFIGILAAGRLTDDWSGRRRSIRIEAQMLGLFCGAPFIYMMGMGATPAICFLGMGIFGLFRGIYESNLYATLFEVVAPRLRSSAVGGMICSAFLFGALSPIIMGALKSHVGLGVALAGLSGVYLLSGILLLIARAGFFHKDCVAPDSVPA